MLYFVTSSKNKFLEAKAIVPNLEQLDIDLPEIQELDAKTIIRAKLLEALNHHKGEFIVEDTSLEFDCLNGLPGPLIKWFLLALGNDGLYKITKKFNNFDAGAKTIIGYAKNHEEICFFEGAIRGKIVTPRGKTNFGWDPIFTPKGFNKTFAEMSKQQKLSLSMRTLAFKELQTFLKK